MKKFLKGIAVALALALVITPCAILFAGCGEPPEEEFTPVGNWVTTTIVYWVTPDDDHADERGITEPQEIVEVIEEG